MTKISGHKLMQLAASWDEDDDAHKHDLGQSRKELDPNDEHEPNPRDVAQTCVVS